MKKTLLISIAALLLATGTAHAGRYHSFKCAYGIDVDTAQNQGHTNNERDVSKDTYDITISNQPTNGVIPLSMENAARC